MACVARGACGGGHGGVVVSGYLKHTAVLCEAIPQSKVFASTWVPSPLMRWVLRNKFCFDLYNRIAQTFCVPPYAVVCADVVGRGWIDLGIVSQRGCHAPQRPSFPMALWSGWSAPPPGTLIALLLFSSVAWHDRVAADDTTTDTETMPTVNSTTVNSTTGNSTGNETSETSTSTPAPTTLTPCTQADCSFHAKEPIQGFRETQCNCTCQGQFVGARCETCPARYAIGNDTCTSCAIGYTIPPFCYKRCSIALNCSGHADGVFGHEGSQCTCTCTIGWEGDTCAVCPPRYDEGGGCSSCASGYGSPTGFPDCQLKCTPSNCSVDFPARVTVSGYANQSCDCKCKGNWAPPTCETCPAPYAGIDCDECVEGRSGPKCQCFCNLNGEPMYFAGNKSCACQCFYGWRGATCDSCPVQFDPSRQCNQCSPGFTGQYPLCSRVCTADNYCYNHSATASGFWETGCTCSACFTNWMGNRCEICPPQFSAEPNCNTCAPGYEPEEGTSNCVPLPTTFTATSSSTSTTTDTVTNTTFTSSTVTSTEAFGTSTTATTVTPTTTTVDPNATSTMASETTMPTLENTTATDSSTTTTMPPTSTNATNETTTTPAPNSTAPSKSKDVERSKSKEPTVPPQPTRSVALTRTRSSNVSRSHSPTTSTSASHSLTRCATELWMCLATNNSEPVPPANCSCKCVNMWSTYFCEYCHPRFNKSQNCGNCSSGYVDYPKCDFAYFAVGNWSITASNAAHMKPFFQGKGLELVAADVNLFLGSNRSMTADTLEFNSSVFALFGCTPLDNITAFALRVFPQTLDNGTTSTTWSIEMDVEFRDQDRQRVLNATECVFKAISTHPPPLNRSIAAIRQMFPDAPNATVVLGNFSYAANSENPCFPDACRNGPPLPADDVPNRFPWWITAIIVGGAALLLAAVMIAIKSRGKGKFTRRRILKERDLSEAEASLVTSEMSAQALSNRDPVSLPSDVTEVRKRHKAPAISSSQKTAPPKIVADEI